MLVESKSSLSSSGADAGKGEEEIGGRVDAALGMTVGTDGVGAVNLGGTVDWEMGTGNTAIEFGETCRGATTAEIG